MGLATLVIMSTFNLEKQALKGSVVVAHRLSCPLACGIFLEQGLNPCPLAGRFLTTGKSCSGFYQSRKARATTKVKRPQ